jgi:pimeloyl-ACP methyl ester carboxylesterase
MQWRDYQALQRVATLGDRFVSYVDEGQGEPVVLLHGIPTWGYLWSGMLETLSRDHRVLIPDLLGFGFSDKSDRFDRGLGRQAVMIDVWLQQLGVERAVIVGHDLGGGVALRLASLFPARVSRLVLCNSVAYDSWPIELMLQLGHPMAGRLPAAIVERLLRAALQVGFGRRPPPGLVEGLLAPYATEVGKTSLVRCAASLNTNLTMELNTHLHRITAPTLVLWGEEDRFQQPWVGERLAWDIPDAQLVRIPRARHFVMWDRPDELTSRIGGFLMPLRLEIPQSTAWM